MVNTQVSSADSKGPIQPVVRKARAYFIQVVTYTNKVLAEKEKEKLLRIGISSFINLSDRFYQVKAGPFYNKDDALNLQRELKKTYKDCYITVSNRQSNTAN
jgi:cell division protein FtsN